MPRHAGHGSKPEWADGTGHVAANVKSAEKAAFIEWYALPKSYQEPATIKAFAAHVGVAEGTVHRWKRDPRVLAAVKGLALQEIIPSLPAVVESMVAIATDPDHKSAVAAARLLVDMAEKAEKITDTVPLSDMSNDELKELAAGLYDEFDERGSRTA